MSWCVATRLHTEVHRYLAVLVAATSVGCAHLTAQERQPRLAPKPTEPSDNCLVPEPGAFAPDLMWERETIERYALVPEGKLGQVEILLYRDQGNASSYVLLLRELGPNRFLLELRSLRRDPWEQAMEQLRAGQHATHDLSQSRQLGEVLVATDFPPPKKRTREVGVRLAHVLMRIWKSILGRAEYSNAKADIEVAHGDGTTYHFWGNGMSGMTSSPQKGSLMWDVVGLVDKLNKLIVGTLSESELLEMANAVAARADKREACLRGSSE